MFQHLYHVIGVKKKQIMKIINIILQGWIIWTNGFFLGIHLNIARMHLNGKMQLGRFKKEIRKANGS
jgi:hypothetical protein